MNFLIRKTFKRGTMSHVALLLSLSILALMVLHAVSLRYYPPVFVDEAIMISRAWAWLQTGLNFGPLDAGVFDKRFDGYWTFHPLIPTWFHALFVQMFGLDLRLLRLASLLCGTAVLIAVFSISYQLSASSRCGFIAALLVVTSVSFLVSAHHVRYDIIVAALGFSAIAVHLAASHRKSMVLSVLSGLLLGLAFEVHVNAAIYGPVILALFFAEERWHFYRQRAFWGFVVGSMVALAWYLWQHVVRFPEAYFGIGRSMAGTHYPPLFLGDPLATTTALSEMGLYLLGQGQTPFQTVVTGVAAVMLWKRGLAPKPLFMFLIAVVSFALLIKSKMYYYLILIAPFSHILLAEWLEQFVFRNYPLRFWSRVTRGTTTVVLAGSLLFSLVMFLMTFKSPPLNEPKSVAQRIEQVIPKGSSIMGPQTYWFDLHQYRYVSWQNILAYRTHVPQSTFDDAVAALRPDVLVVDDQLRQFILPEQEVVPRSGFERYAWERRLPKIEVDAFLARRGTLKYRVETRNYGTVEIYLINWTDP
jgi:4-amino-4-deoxy-L-arabinose transferase-like glycosyltransferase